MILAPLEQAERYLSLHPAFAAAFDYLRGQDFRELPEGRMELTEKMYAMVSRSPTRRRDEARLEAHRRYIDIQYVISGNEEMGWRPRSRCQQTHVGYHVEKDIEFYADAPENYIAVQPADFVIFFPEDAHAPLIGNGTIHKVVVKVRV